jgi:hypothetical protein
VKESVVNQVDRPVSEVLGQVSHLIGEDPSRPIQPRWRAFSPIGINSNVFWNFIQQTPFRIKEIEGNVEA